MIDWAGRSLQIALLFFVIMEYVMHELFLHTEDFDSSAGVPV